jgi:hypothetical protein
MEDITTTVQALWDETVIAFGELDDLRERGEEVYAALRFATPGSDTYKRIDSRLKQLQTKWDSAFGKFTDAKAKFTAHAQAANITDSLISRLVVSPINCARARQDRTVMH